MSLSIIAIRKRSPRGSFLLHKAQVICMMHYGLLGKAIAYTLSPLIHNALFRAKGLSCDYKVFDCDDPLDAFLPTLELSGFNVTIPYKVQMLAHIDVTTPEAELAGAVNVIKCTPGGWIGHNTDGLGFIMGLEARNYDISGQTIVILGTGGAARGIAAAMAQAGVQGITFVSRDPQQRLALIEMLSKHFPSCHFKGESLSDHNALIGDLLVNTLPSHVDSCLQLDQLQRFKGTSVADIVYKPQHTPLLVHAQERDFRLFFGIDMLFYQAVLAQEFWFGEHPVAIEQIRQEVYREAGFE